MKCPECGETMLQLKSKQLSHYECQNPNCPVIDVWFERITYQASQSGPKRVTRK